MTACDGDDQWVNEACAPKCNPSSGIWINISFWSEIIERNNRENPSKSKTPKLQNRKKALFDTCARQLQCEPSAAVRDGCEQGIVHNHHHVYRASLYPSNLVIMLLCSRKAIIASWKGIQARGESWRRSSLDEQTSDITWLVTTYWPEPTGFLNTH
jgi:hypothetical protein